ncbi:hypothetical protein XH81_04295 [Bradyrhizobium sp. CCBAU 25360]|uniref:hypothetical protein n=1 Tax=Bradyrhizobium sp. CCBAU 25360 TaxID=858425 RepID=UPI0023062FEE|nr:hypothetical protein [Bradyrhizobium sp. CCBAU 25360]MDA9414085.1 hypothetical protein [Bradyrhizobium sp. CCBAU 25360]
MTGDAAANAVHIGMAIFELLGTYALACFVGAGGGVLVARTYLSQKIKAAIKSEYEERLEVLKADLKASNDTQLERLKAQRKAQGDVAIEQLKSELAIAAAQRNVEFSHLHLKRAEVLAEVHALLRDAIDATADYTKAFEPAGGTSREERGIKAAKATNEFIRAFRTKEIYLPESAAEKVRAISDELKFAFFQFLYGVNPGGDLSADRTKKLHEIQEKIERLSGPATKELQTDFRNLLGYQAGAQPVGSRAAEVTKQNGDQVGE